MVTLNSSVLTTTDINGGTIDNTVIGGATPAAGTFTSVDTDYVDFAPALSPLPANITGRLYYDNSDQFQTLVFQMNGSVVQKIGEEQFYRIKCSGPIIKGQVVMFAGTLGASGGLVGAAATGLTPEQSNYILGVAAESGVNNDWITVTSFGEIKNINTTGGAEVWVQGQVLYYNPSVTGGLTKNKPTAPNAIAVVAAVVHVGTSNGVLFVRPTFGSVLGGTDGNVQFGTLSNGDVIVYDATQSRWENASQSTLSVGSAALATAATNVAGGGANRLVYNTGSSTTSFVAAPTVANTFLEWSGSAFQWSANPLGTVTSVGLALPSEFTVSNSPVTNSGTLTGAWANQTANYIFAAPNGSPGTPTFRAMVAADVPTLNQNTTGSAGSVVNSVTFSDTGGGVVNSAFNGSSALTVSYSTVGAPKADGTGASGTWGINISGNAATATSATSASTATTATNVAGGAAGSIPYQTGAGVTAMLAAGSGVLIGGSTPSYSTAPSLTGTNFTSIPNAALQNSSVTIGTTSISLGASSLTLAGLTSIDLTQNPTTALQAATKQYVDNLVAAGTVYHTPVKYEVTTGNLTATYNNGTAGVGATLTNSGTLAAFAPDGPTAQVGDRILVYTQTNQFENGVYEVTTVGNGSTPWVLTRTTDTDSYGLNDATALGEGSTFFVTSGNTGAGETYTCNTVGTITFGTTAITFAQISATQVYSAGTGLTLTGTQFALSTPVVLANGGTGLTSYTAGDLPYFAAGTAFSKLAIGSSTYMLTSSGTAPQWTNPASITVGNATTAASATTATTATTATNVAGGAANQIVYNTASGTTSFIAAPVTAGHFLKWNGSAFAWDVAGTGSVTSVGMTVPTGLVVSGSPVTTSGTLAVTFDTGYSIPTTASQSNWDTAYADRLKWDGGSTGLNASTGRTSLGGTTVGQNFFTLANPSAITFPRMNADNSVSTLNAADFRTAIGAGTGNGTVTSIVAGSYLTGGTITTTGTIAVDATSANTANKVVARDASGNFSAGTITAALNGNASTATSATSATSATTASNVAGGAANQIVYNTGTGATSFAAAPSVSGQVLGWNGTAFSWVTGTISGVSLGSNLSNLTAGTYLTGTAYNGGTAQTWSVDATSANTASKVVARDASGNFSAGTITAALSGNASTATTLQTARNINEVSFNGSANITIPRVRAIDDRTAAPADGTASYATFGFGSWNNNNTSPYADFWLMRSYQDATGGSDNMVAFRKDALGMRVWQQAYGSATAFSTYKDVAWTDGSNASGSWNITAAVANTVSTTANSTNTNFFIPFVATSTTSNQALQVDAGITYNPSTNAITGGISGGTF